MKIESLLLAAVPKLLSYLIVFDSRIGRINVEPMKKALEAQVPLILQRFPIPQIILLPQSSEEELVVDAGRQPSSSMATMSDNNGTTEEGQQPQQDGNESMEIISNDVQEQSTDIPSNSSSLPQEKQQLDQEQLRTMVTSWMNNVKGELELVTRKKCHSSIVTREALMDLFASLRPNQKKQLYDIWKDFDKEIEERMSRIRV